MKKLDLIGQRFGRLTVKKEAGKNNGGNYLWKCQCSCGNITIVAGGNLRSGNTKACGCLQHSSALTHGMYYTPTYQSWEHMCSRCNNPKNDRYYDYGGRGIRVCGDWLKFENFFNDMGIRPEGMTIDRIDNNLGYFKENCKWSTPIEQSRNQRIKKNNKTGISGVCWNKSAQKYTSQITVSGKKLHLGYFSTIDNAKNARMIAEQKYWGKTSYASL